MNDIKTDSVIADDGYFTWKGNLADISFMQFNAKDYIKFPPKFLIAPGNYSIQFDTVTKFFIAPLTNEKSNYTAYEVKANDKLV
jgi:hypothetical protein